MDHQQAHAVAAGNAEANTQKGNTDSPLVELPESQAPVQEEKTDDKEQVASSALPIPAEPAAPSMADSTPVPAPEANAPAQPLSTDAAPSVTPPPAAAPAAPPAKARSVKTPLQKEALEAAYRVKKFPDEAIRRALGERIQLSEAQVAIWFSHRRRKDRIQEEKSKQGQIAQPTSTNVAPAASSDAPADSAEVRLGGRVPDSAKSEEPQANGHLKTGDAQSDGLGVPSGSLQHVDTATRHEHAATKPLAGGTVDAHGSDQPLLDQKPALPKDPPIAMSAAILRLMAFVKEQRPHPNLPPSIQPRLPELLALAKSKMTVPFLDAGPPLIAEFDDPPEIRPDGTYADEDGAPVKRKHVDGEDEGPARKRRPPPRNDGEKAERERKRAEEKAVRDRKKTELAQEKEEKKQRMAQEREEKKQQLLAAKEAKAQQRKEAINERRKEKEVLKALQAQEKQATRLRQSHVHSGPRDDLDLEWEALLKAQQEEGYASGTEEGQNGSTGVPQRPEFPPPELGYLPLFPPELPEEVGSNILFVWSFLHSFRNVLGVQCLTFDELLQALMDGHRSRVLGELHISMLRIVQADMEEAHATGAMQSGPTINFLDKAIVSCASMLEEAWAWGFDIDLWRAHLNCVTWPEVLRQMAILWGLGPKRPKPRRRETRPKMGTDGEDLVADEAGGLRLRLPPRLGIGTVKAAAWQILAEEGPTGLPIPEIARRIQQSGLRDLRTTKTPEASIAGALARDVIFARVAPSTFALQAVVAHQSTGTLGVDKAHVENGGPTEGSKTNEEKPEAHGEGEEEDDGDSSGEEDEDETRHQAKSEEVGEPWLKVLLTKDYALTTLDERVAMLTSLVHLTVDGPTVRNNLELRLEEQGKVRKKMWEDARSDKKKRQEEAEAVARAKEAAEAARQSVEPATRAASLAPEISDASDGGREEAGSVRATPEPQPQVDPEPAAKEDELAKPAVDKDGDVEMDDVSQKAQEPEQNIANPDSMQPPTKTDQVKKEEEDRATPGPENGPGRGGRGTPAPADRDGSVVPKSETGGPGRKSEQEAAAIAAAAAAQKQRQLLRAETIRKAEEANATRAEPLGLDRRHNKYWRFVDANDGREDSFAGRLVVESTSDGSHRIIYTAEGVDGLIAALDKRGLREGPLYNNLVRYRSVLTDAMPSSTVRMPAQRSAEEEGKLEDSLSALTGDITSVGWRTAGSRPTKRGRVENPGLEQCRSALLGIAQATPVDALDESWAPHSWQEQVQAAESVEDLKPALEAYEGALQEGWLAPQYLTERALVKNAWLGKPSIEASSEPSGAAASEAAATTSSSRVPLAWIPNTTAALLLRILALDAAVFYDANAPTGREILSGYRYTMRPLPLCKPKKQAEKDSKEGDANEPQPVSTAGAKPSETDGPSHSSTVQEVRLQVIAGQAVGLGGRALPTLFPPFPNVFAREKRKTFSLDWGQLRKEIEDEKNGIMPPPLIIKRPALPAGDKGKGGRASARTAAKGKGKGKASKAKGRGSKSALRDEFDRQSEEEEAAERAAFSTPGFSDDESEADLVFKRTRDEDLEISD